METFITIKCSQIITKNRIEKESKELDEYFETSRKRKFAEVVNEFVGAADLSLFTMTAVNTTILSISKETAPKLPDRVKDTTWWSNGYVNWNEEDFKHRMQIERETFTRILEITSPHITKHPTIMKPNPTTDDRQSLPVLMQRVPSLLMSIFLFSSLLASL